MLPLWSIWPPCRPLPPAPPVTPTHSEANLALTAPNAPDIDSAFRDDDFPPGLDDEFKWLDQIANVATTPQEALFSVPAASTWVLDSGASAHMTPSRRNFVPHSVSDQTIRTACGSILQATHVGSVDLQLPGTSSTLPLRNVLLAPDIKTSLISVKALIQDGFTLLFTGDSCQIRKGTQLIFTVTFKSNDN